MQSPTTSAYFSAAGDDEHSDLDTEPSTVGSVAYSDCTTNPMMVSYDGKHACG